jgi:hypothetical protein
MPVTVYPLPYDDIVCDSDEEYMSIDDDSEPDIVDEF